MEIVGGFMVMMSIIGLFLAVIWLIMPFVVFAIKGKQDRTLEVLESIEKRLAVLEGRLGAHIPAQASQEQPAEQSTASSEPENGAADPSAAQSTGGMQ
ncbi:MAG: hypothetical protein A2076_10230 [Geobacteraceae bacterium GWC2_53_11]|nr:MAG: hypothetical protein A2076_10230 [Geobacteraceae bacterium GWC2_53_11]